MQKWSKLAVAWLLRPSRIRSRHLPAVWEAVCFSNVSWSHSNPKSLFVQPLSLKLILYSLGIAEYHCDWCFFPAMIIYGGKTDPEAFMPTIAVIHSQFPGWIDLAWLPLVSKPQIILRSMPRSFRSQFHPYCIYSALQCHILAWSLECDWNSPLLALDLHILHVDSRIGVYTWIWVWVQDGLDSADNKSWARWRTFDIWRGRPRWSISRIHLESLQKLMVFDSLQAFLREAIPSRRAMKVLLGTSKTFSTGGFWCK